MIIFADAMPKHLIVVVGPTGVGKTDCCITLASALGTEIVSADSRQVYRGMRIGTAQPTLIERQRATHHLVDFLSVDAPYSAGAFEKDALKVLRKLFAQHDHAILSGGSGLYVQAVCSGLPAIPADWAVKKHLNQQLEEQGLSSLQTMLQTQDPDYFYSADIQNPRRVMRALEVCALSGRPYSSFIHQRQKRPFKIIKIGLSRDRQELYRRTDLRVEKMLAEGLMREVEALYDCRRFNALQTIGYQEFFAFLSRACSFDEAVTACKAHTRQYAKRQLSWFKRDKEIKWFYPSDIEGMMQYINQKRMAHCL